VPKTRKQQNAQNIRICRDEFEAAQQNGTQQQIASAAASLGLALFQAYKMTEGQKYFNQADQISKQLEDFRLQVHCLGIKALAYQFVGRYPEAFKVAEEIFEMAVERDDDELRFDAYASMGQILLESGEPVLALEKFQAAQKISDNLDDPRRAMNIRSAMGNHALNVGAPEQAFEYFEDAMALAVSLGDKKTEIGLLGNIGTILSWNDKHQEAIQTFEKVLSHVRSEGNKTVEGSTLRHIVNSHFQLGEFQKVIQYGSEGLVLQEWMDEQTTIFFYEKIIATHYQMKQNDAAEAVTLQAIEFADKSGEKPKKLDFLLSLGESYLLANKFEHALEIYQQALDVAQRIQKMVDYSYLIGRIGIIHAELGQLDKAIQHHQQAILHAQKHKIVELEAEQAVMIAMAYRDKGELTHAKAYCQRGIEIYANADLDAEANNARQLLAEIEAGLD
jgi:tetratricopeptide (TPR) repeat protein